MKKPFDKSLSATIRGLAGCGLIFLGAGFPASAAPPKNFYLDARDKTGVELRAALHDLIDGHQVIPYRNQSGKDTVAAVIILDEFPDSPGSVRLIYSRRREPAEAFPHVWNREHLWPNSYGLHYREPAYSDVFNLRPADSNVNSSRGNHLYDVSDPNDSRFRSPGHVEAEETQADRDSWEPPMDVRGDIARALFYMDIRYEGDAAREPDLGLTDDIGKIKTDSPWMGRLSTLIIWHFLDPVDDSERRRNDLIFSEYQGNRNPFVDHPEWVALVYGTQPHTNALSIDRVGEGVQISWPDAYNGMVVEKALSLDGKWMRLSGSPSLEDGRWVLYLDSIRDPSFYRLQHP